MVNKLEIEKSLKRFLKKKVSYSFALLIAFMISGEIVAAVETGVNTATQSQKLSEAKDLYSLIKMLRKEKTVEKKEDKSTQFFFSFFYEKRKAKKYDANGFIGNGGTEDTGKPDIKIPDNITPPDYIDIEQPKMPDVTVTEPEFTFDNPQEVVIGGIHNGVEIDLGQDNVNVSEITDDSLKQNTPDIADIQLNNDIKMEIELTDVGDTNIDIQKPTVELGYDPHIFNAPDKIEIDPIEAPENFSIDAVKISGKGFAQNAERGAMKNRDTLNSVAQNIRGGVYKPTGETFNIRISQNDFWYGSGMLNGNIDFGDKTADGSDIGAGDQEDGNGLMTGLEELRTWFNNDNGNNDTEAGAIFSDLVFDDVTVEGKYNIKYELDGRNGGENYIRIFLSVNPAGIWDPDYDGNEKIATKITEIKENAEINLFTKEKEGTEFNGNLIALEHQLYDAHNRKVLLGSSYQIPEDYMRTSSVLLNNGTINLGSSDENGTDKEYSKNMIGIMIDQEESNKSDTTGANGTGDKTVNNKTINNGTININGTSSIGMSFEEYLNQAQYEQDTHNTAGSNYKNYYMKKGHFILRDDAYIGNINVKGTNNYAFRMGNIFDELPDYTAGKYKGTFNSKTTYENMYKYEFATYFDRVKIIGTDGEINIEDKDNSSNNKEISYTSKINVAGEKNAGLVIGKSLSAGNKRYGDLGLTDEVQGIGSNDRWGIHWANPDAYTDELLEKALTGDTNPIDNFEGIKIAVGGTNNIGFVRDRDYSDNNKNDMIINDKNITDIHFTSDAKNSVLIRSEQYGITMGRDFEIKFENGEQVKSDDKYSNIVMQATAQSWEKEYKYNKSNGVNGITDNKKVVNSVGTVTNDNKIHGEDLKNVVAMMASGYAEGKNDGMYDGLGIGHELSEDKKTSKARVVNNGTIELTGSNNIGMAVLDNNEGFLGTDLKGANLTGDKVIVSTLKGTEDIEGNVSNVAVYNTGTFTIGNADIISSGQNSAGIYNTTMKYETTKVADPVNTTTAISDGKIVINADTNIEVSQGAVGIYSSGGTVEAKNGLILTSKDNNDTGAGVYATDGANVDLTNATINITDGAMGLGAIGKNTNGTTTTASTINITGGDINYSGKGYALYADEGGKIILEKTSVTLGDQAYGYNFDVNNKDAIIFDKDTVFNINSNTVTIASVIDKESITTYNSSNIKDTLGLANVKIEENGFDGYKIAAIDGGKITIDGDNNGTIDDTDTQKNMEFLQKYKFQRVNLTLAENQTIDMTIDNDEADTYFGGEVTGLGMSASNSIEKDKLNLDSTSITLGKNSHIIADRKENAIQDDNKKDKNSVGVYMNYGTVTLNEGSSITVENNTDTDTNYVQENGVGIFAVNGSKVDVAKNAEITVHGNNAVGIYAQSFTEKDEDGKNRFGKDETESSITNAGDITLTGEGAIGIYVDNNNGKDTLNSYENTSKIKISNSGNITVGGILEKDGEKISSIGIYGINTDISNEGTITVGSNDKTKLDEENTTGAVGIYAENSEVSNIGNIVLGDYSTGVYVDKDSTISNTSDVTFGSLADNQTTRVGIILDGGENGQTSTGSKIDETELNFSIDMSSVVGGKAVVAENRNVTLGNDKEITISGVKGRGLRVSQGTTTNNGTIILNAGNADSTSGSIGMLAIDKNGTIANNGTIKIDSDYGVGIYIDNQREGAENNTISEIGNITLNSNHATGVVLKGAGEINVDNDTFGANGINFTDKATNSVGIYADGENANINVTNGTDIDVTLNGEKGNVLLYAENGGTINNSGNITVEGTENITDNYNVGVYLGSGGKYTGAGTLKAENGIIGLYGDTANGNINIENGNIIVDSQGISTIGVALVGNDTEKRTGNISGTITLTNTNDKADKKNQSTGVYLNNTELTLGDLTVNHGENNNGVITGGSNGTAIYIDNGSSVNGGTLTLSGNSLTLADGSTPKSIGIYYSKNADETLSSDTNIVINKSNTIGVYLNGEDGSKTLTHTGNITLGENTESSIGISSTGKDVNEKSNLTFGKNADNTINISGTKNIGIAGAYTDITNKGTITIEENSISGTGVIVGNGSTFTNEGTINVNETSASGANGHLGIGIYLGDNSELLEAGKINVASGNAGVYVADNGSIKSDVDIKDSTGAIGIIAGKSATVNGAKDTGKSVITIGSKSTGIYSLGGTTIENIKVTSEDKADTPDKKLSMGIYLADSETENLTHTVKNSEIVLNEGIGIVTGSSEKQTNTLNLSGTSIKINSGNNSETGIGIYLGTNGTLTSAGGNTLDIVNGIGVYGKENSTINIGGTDEQSKDTINLNGYSIGAYSNKGTINIGEHTTINSVGTDVEGSVAYGINSNITNNASMEVTNSKNFMGLFTKYTSDVQEEKNITNTGDIIISGEKAYGIVAVNGTWKDGVSTGDENSQANTIENSGNITVSGKVQEDGSISAGIYTEGSGITNSGIITAGDATVAVAYNNLSKNDVKHDITLNNGTGKIVLNGTRGIGVSLKGEAGNVSIGNIEGDTDKSENLGLYLSEFSADTFSIGDIILGNSSLGIYAKDTNINIGNVNIEAGNDSIGVAVSSNSEITLGNATSIEVGERGTGLYAGNGSTITINNLSGITVGSDGTYAHADGGTINMTGLSKKEITINDNIGFIVSNSGNIKTDDGSTLDKMIVTNGGVGMIIKGNAERPDIIGENTEIVLANGKSYEDNDETKWKYATGIYYQKASNLNASERVQLTFNDNTNHAAGIVFDRTYGSISYENGINVNKGTDNVGIVIKRNQNEKDKITEDELKKSFDLTSNINVSGSGNIGLVGNNSIINLEGDITTTASKDSENHYPIGVYLRGDDEKVDHKFTQTGNISVGENSTGIYARNYDVEVNGTDTNIIDVSKGGIGIFAESDEKHTNDTLHSLTVTGENINVAESDVDSENKSVGIYSKNNNVDVTLAGTMNVGTNGSIGIYSVGNGNITFSGKADIENNSYGIYKTDTDLTGEGAGSTGNITVGNSDWNIGDHSYGIIVNASRNSEFKIENNANLTLGMSGIGISSYGKNTLTNNGNITVGEASIYPDDTVNAGEKKPSVGIYMANPFGWDTVEDQWSTGTNNGEITVSYDGSVGIYTLGNVKFSNEGNIVTENGGTGILAGLGSQIINNGNVTADGEGSVGIRAEDEGTVVDNYGTIEAKNGGTGVVISDEAVFNHNSGANLIIDGATSYGVRGNGIFNNNGGTVKIENGGTLYDDTAVEEQAIVVTENEVILNKNYQTAGGILDTELNVKLNGMVVDISEGKGLGINASDIYGDVTLDSKFALSGDGINYEIEDFVAEGEDINVNTSKLYKTDLTEDGALKVTKDKYTNIMKNDRFENFYNSIDDSLQAGGSNADILKGMNFYLNNLGQSNLFDREAARITSEMQGDIYGTVQSRMRDINKAFDNSFDEMAEAYNPAVENNKISLIQGYGENKNSNRDMIDYDYTVTGVQYMKQYDGLDSSRKYGYHFGFAVSEFEFDDFQSSEESVYSLRAGVHNIKYFENGISLLSKAEIGYNRHDVERKVNYGHGVYENDAEFNSYEVSLDNKVSKALYENENMRVGIYTGLNLEYGRFDDINEDGDIAIKVKANDYLSSKAMAGFEGSMTAYFENDWSVEFKGDIGYSYDFGENYKENEAKVKGEDRGYYSLLSDVETKGEAGAKIGVTFKKSETMAVTLEGEYSKDFERDENYWRAGLRFTYKFDNGFLTNPLGLFEGHFDFDSYNLKADDTKEIEKVSKIVDKKKAKGTLVIEGHTDNIGKEIYNQTLSEKRAENVEKEFKKNIKNSKIQYDVKGYGETKPISDNSTKEGRASNRRVDVKFVKSK